MLPSPGTIQRVSSAGERGRERTSQLREGEVSGGCKDTGGATSYKGGARKDHTSPKWVVTQSLGYPNLRSWTLPPAGLEVP